MWPRCRAFAIEHAAPWRNNDTGQGSSVMLNALAVLATGSITDAHPFDAAGFLKLPTHVVDPWMTPNEPSTLALAAIGIGMIAIYATTQRVWRSHRAGATITAFPSKPTVTGRQKRGAA